MRLLACLGILCYVTTQALTLLTPGRARLCYGVRPNVAQRGLLASVEDSVYTTSQPVAAVSSRPLPTHKMAASGASLEMSGVSLSVGNADLISDINWTIMPRERWALVGQNGAGKSTLLRALTNTGGELVSLRDGEIAVAKKSRFGYLEQKGVSGSVLSVRQEVSSRMDRLTAATNALSAIEARVGAGDTSDEALSELADASVEFEAAGGYTVEQKISNVLRGLGFLEADYDRLCGEFSGGWQMRIALARLLLSEPDLLILDEPTNHLDKGARDWLAGYLCKYDGTLLLVSHDVGILNTAVTSIAEVRAGKIELYKSRSYAQWQVEREERVRDAQAKYDAAQREIARLQTYIDRFGAKTMGASLAQSKRKDIEKLEASVQAPVTSEGPLPFLKLPPPPRGSKDLLSLKGAMLGWNQNAGSSSSSSSNADSSNGNGTGPAGGGAVLSDVTLQIERGMRIVVRGPNGAGKSTLLSALSGKLTPISGTRTEGDGLELGVFTQDLAQDLDQEDLAVNVVTKKVRQFDATISDEKARSALGALGLRGEKATRKVGHLSGGEKARVALASFVLQPHNLLLLDEPSNHLDHQTLSTLTTALRTFEGATLVISHDREFLTELEPTHVLTVRGGRAVLEERGLRESDFDDPLDSRVEPKFAQTPTQAQAQAQAQAATKTGGKKSSAASASTSLPHSPAATAATSTSQASVPMSDEERKKRLNAPRRIKKIEQTLEKHDADTAAIDADMVVHGRDTTKLRELQSKKEAILGKSAKLLEEMEELLLLV